MRNEQNLANRVRMVKRNAWQAARLHAPAPEAEGCGHPDAGEGDRPTGAKWRGQDTAAHALLAGTTCHRGDRTFFLRREGPHWVGQMRVPDRPEVVIQSSRSLSLVMGWLLRKMHEDPRIETSLMRAYRPNSWGLEPFDPAYRWTDCPFCMARLVVRLLAHREDWAAKQTWAPVEEPCEHFITLAEENHGPWGVFVAHKDAYRRCWSCLCWTPDEADECQHCGVRRDANPDQVIDDAGEDE